MKTYSAYRRSRICGEDVTLTLDIHEDRIVAVRAKGDYSKVCEASIDALNAEKENYTLANIDKLIQLAYDLFANQKECPTDASEAVKKMSHLRWFPNRVPAAKLPWQALEDILQQVRGIQNVA